MKCPVCKKDFDFPAYFAQDYKIPVGAGDWRSPKMEKIGVIIKPICPWCNSQLFDEDTIKVSQFKEKDDE